MLEKTLESPLDCKEIQPVHPKGDRSWVFTGRTDAEAEALILWPPRVKSWLIRKDPDGGRDWAQEEKGMTEDEMAGWHHRLNGHEFEWSPGVGDGQGGLACCDSWRCKESYMTEPLNWTELNQTTFVSSCIPHVIYLKWPMPQVLGPYVTEPFGLSVCSSFFKPFWVGLTIYSLLKKDCNVLWY